MRDQGDWNDRPDEGRLSTEDIADPGGTDATDATGATGSTDAAGATDQPVYPGEATADRDDEPGAEDDGVARDEAPAAGETAQDETAQDEPLLSEEETTEYRTSWSEIQGRFVDDPQEAVRSADTLVAEVMQTLARTFSEHKQGLEAQWDRGEQVATEDLRLALQRYRSFFNRLLKT
ncbi:hypothetical protein AB0D94_30190 [Streptomyces sp. NPDC048255]|uniref:hypothetical protein n=1 Tax=Streptomyces TaxID=1883 RepID=UPI0033CF2560